MKMLLRPLSILVLTTQKQGKTITKSTIITMDNMQAIMEQKTTVIYKLQSHGIGGDVASEEIEAGIVLTVTPHIIEADKKKTMIELVIQAERSSFVESTSPDLIPDTVSTDLSTQAIIESKGTLVVGGLFESRYSRSETGIPCLMGIPALGYLFKTAEARNPKDNILFFLTPEVIALDEIPYEGPELEDKIKGYEKELEQIDPDKRERLIERYQE